MKFGGIHINKKIIHYSFYRKKAVRIIYNGSYTFHTAPIFCKLKLLTLYNLIDFKTSIIMYKANNLLLPIRTQKYFEKIVNSKIITRSVSNQNFYQKSVRTTMKSMCVSCKGVKVWNNLPLEICLSQNLNNYIKKETEAFFYLKVFNRGFQPINIVTCIL